MFKTQELEQQRKIYKYKNHICLEGICILDNGDWMIYINDQAYNSHKRKIKDRFIIKGVSKNALTLFDLRSKIQVKLKVGENYKITPSITTEKSERGINEQG